MRYIASWCIVMHNGSQHRSTMTTVVDETAGLVTLRKAQELLRVNYRTLRKAIDAGHIKSMQFGDRERITMTEINRVLGLN